MTYCPETLEDVQMNIVFGELVVDAQISIWSREDGGIGHNRHDGRGGGGVGGVGVGGGCSVEKCSGL